MLQIIVDSFKWAVDVQSHTWNFDPLCIIDTLNGEPAHVRIGYNRVLHMSESAIVEFCTCQNRFSRVLHLLECNFYSSSKCYSTTS